MIDRIRAARQRMKRSRIVHFPNKLRAIRLEAMRVLDTRGATRVSCPKKWVQSYVALKSR